MEVVSWFIFFGWAMIALIKNYNPIIFLGCCIGIGLACIANSFKKKG